MKSALRDTPNKRVLSGIVDLDVDQKGPHCAESKGSNSAHYQNLEQQKDPTAIVAVRVGVVASLLKVDISEV